MNNILWNLDEQYLWNPDEQHTFIFYNTYPFMDENLNYLTYVFLESSVLTHIDFHSCLMFLKPIIIK